MEEYYFQQTVLGQFDIHMQKIKLDGHLPHNIYKKIIYK